MCLDAPYFYFGANSAEAEPCGEVIMFLLGGDYVIPWNMRQLGHQ